MWMIDIAEDGDTIQMRMYSNSTIADITDFRDLYNRGAAHETSLWVMVF